MSEEACIEEPALCQEFLDVLRRHILPLLQLDFPVDAVAVRCTCTAWRLADAGSCYDLVEVRPWLKLREVLPVHLKLKVHLWS